MTNDKPILKERELHDLWIGVLIVTENNDASFEERKSASDDVSHLISDHRRMRAFISGAMHGDFCTFTKDCTPENCIFLEVTNGK